jgi:probable HAF family extracellular repeat protein
VNDGGPSEAFRWQYGGSLESLGSGTSAALDISADASTIVGYGSSGAFMHQGGVVTYLPDLPGGGTTAYAWGVSGDGSVIVGQGTSSSGTEAFRWQAGVMTGLGDLAGGTFESFASDITLDGSVVVGKGTGASGGEAFRWEGGVMTGLGQLGGVPTIAYAVTADGSTIVGTAYDSNAYNGVATIWDAQHGMRDLKAVLQQEFGLDLSAYVLTSANGISIDGLTIAGTGRSLSSGQQIGWMVTIPEPATLPLFASGMLGLAMKRRRG